MTDFNALLGPGDYENYLVNAIVEIPMGSCNKVQYDREKAMFYLDRVEPTAFPKPVNYGFIPRTIDEDDDELDVLVVSPEPLPTGLFVEARIIGVMNFRDEEVMDYKIITVPAEDRDRGNSIQTIADLGEAWIQHTEFHFEHYKHRVPGAVTEVLGWGDKDEAVKVIVESIERWNEMFPHHNK